MLVKKVFVDGSAGTTGLGIMNRLKDINGIELMKLDEEIRKDTKARREALNSCDIALLCLPDDAAKEAVSLIDNKDVIVIDASTAHRTEPGWVYGLPELSQQQREAIKHAKRIAVPGCHASGFIALVNPLIQHNFISKDVRLTCHSITGYSGGGKKMIAEYENPERETLYNAPRQYGLTQNHKHLREMVHMTGLTVPPVFCPIVSDFYSGMLVTVPLFAQDLNPGVTVNDIKNLYQKHYCHDNVHYEEQMDTNGFINANMLSGTDVMKISVLGNDERILLTALYDNLGKGASGAAVQCLNLILAQG